MSCRRGLETMQQFADAECVFGLLTRATPSTGCASLALTSPLHAPATDNRAAAAADAADHNMIVVNFSGRHGRADGRDWLDSVVMGLNEVRSATRRRECQSTHARAC